jgi:NAD(P)H-quinone oxidoreductase subunit 5
MLGSAFAMALAYALWNLWSRALSPLLALCGAVFGGGLVAAYFSLHKLFAALLGGNDWVNGQLGSLPGLALLATLLALFLAVLVLQTELPQWANRPLFQALYVHARNGFYFTTLANRTVTACWSAKTISRNN